MGASFPTPVEEQSAAGVMRKGEAFPAPEQEEERAESAASFFSAQEPREGTVPGDTKLLSEERVVSPVEGGPAAQPLAGKKAEGEGEAKFPERLHPPALGMGLSSRPGLEEEEMMESMSQISTSGRRRGSIKKVKCTVM